MRSGFERQWGRLHGRAVLSSPLLDFLTSSALLGVTQPRVSDLMRGKIHLFSIDTLVNLLAAAGLKVDLRVSRAA